MYYFPMHQQCYEVVGSVVRNGHHVGVRGQTLPRNIQGERLDAAMGGMHARHGQRTTSFAP